MALFIIVMYKPKCYISTSVSSTTSNPMTSSWGQKAFILGKERRLGVCTIPEYRIRNVYKYVPPLVDQVPNKLGACQNDMIPINIIRTI